MIDKIIENMYLSDVYDVLDEFAIDRLQNDLKISHILTIAAECIPVEKQISGISYKFIFALDTDAQDMFADDLLANALMYIKTSMENNGRILVHCEAGISRSVFVVAAYLMRKFQWSSTKAVEYIQKIRPIALPNDGFMQQLQIFESCHFMADIRVISQCSLYKNWLLKISSTNAVSCARFSVNEKSTQSVDSISVRYRCRKCRKFLFNDQHIMRHKTVEAVDCNFDYIISLMDWMSLKEHRGKIFCSCNEKLGHYDWGGRVCEGMIGRPCGRAVRPWIYINRNKIDRIVKGDQNSLISINSIISRPPIFPGI